ncbi:MAG: sprT domain-containing protein [Flavobacteriia bacterium]|nr:sprT domain-containing protein [Flavobacteriia bacterium]
MEKAKINSKEQVKKSFQKFLPQGFENYVVDLFFAHSIHFKIVPPRKSKLGDFRVGEDLPKPLITVNGDLNPYSFLITTLHEFAHLHTYLEFGFKVAPHGEEWKIAYRKLLLPVINSGNLPQDVEKALVNSLISTKASSCTDINLSRVLQNYDIKKEGLETLEQIPKNTIFVLNGRKFVKGDFRRKKFLCQDLVSKKMFLVNALAQVIPIK